ncbi:putative inorganic phosphate cotransporter isoform X1 [Palaemon carinicauda]|uniref:putative inorganic phosphate cotransporter isoform X1 n=1 Tax=Palaemon carinicauda TaxID=392227 RepID=UPI0035B633ED
MSLDYGSIRSKTEGSDSTDGQQRGLHQVDQMNDDSYSKSLTNLSNSRAALVETHGDESGEDSCWGARHTLVFLGFLGISCVYAMRVNLSVAIVAMVKSQPKNNTNSSESSDVCRLPDGYDPSDDANIEGDFEWNEATQGMILGSFFYGYILTNVLGGWASERIGGKMVYGLGIVITALLTILSPLCAEWSTGLFIAVRVLEGAAEGVTFPAVHHMLARWVPLTERARFTAFVYAGCQFGTVITMPISGWLCDTDFLGGWPSVFYIFGALGLVWGVVWFLMISDHPETHLRISEREKNYIMESCGTKQGKAPPIPLKAIFTSMPFWAIMVVHFGQNWGFFTLLTELPTYLKNIQHFDMKSNGLLSALPYFTMWVVSLLYSQLIDRLYASGKISTLAVRRISMIIGIYGPMVSLIAMCFVDCNEVLAIVVLCLAVGSNGAVYCGYMCSHQDLAPNFAGVLMGFTNTVSNIPGFIAPSIIGLIIKNNQTLTAWRTVFLIAAGVYLVTNTFYLIFISTATQPWNYPKESHEKDESKKRY